MRFSRKLITAPVVAIAVCASVVSASPSAFADGGQNALRDAAAVESVGQRALGQKGPGLILDNLRKGTIRMFPSGTQVTVLKLASKPQVSGDGVYFAYSTTREHLVRLVTGMDTPEFAVTDWKSVMIGLPPEGEMTEVRYGDPEHPEESLTVGTARYTSE